MTNSDEKRKLREIKAFVDGIDTDEVWKDVIGYEGIALVSNYGRVKTLDREVEYTQTNQHNKIGTKSKKLIKGKMLLSKTPAGYVRVSLYDGDRYVHRLVVESFIRPLNKGEEVNHLDGNKRNNHISNLEICTRTQNQDHAYYCGLSKFKPSIAVKINGVRFNSIGEAARFYGVTKGVILGKLRNKNYRPYNGAKTISYSVERVDKD